MFVISRLRIRRFVVRLDHALFGPHLHFLRGDAMPLVNLDHFR